MKKSKYNPPKADKLNLGCGQFKKPGFVNVDFDSRVNPDLVWNLDNLPYPFPEGSFSLIEADHVLEHLKDPFNAMKEFHRLLKKDGIVTIRVPHFSRGFTHPDHKRGFDVSFPLYFNPRYKAFYWGFAFNLIKMRLSWFAQPYMKKKALPRYQYYFGLIVGNLIDVFANISPYFCSRIWCFLVGGFDEISYVFRKSEYHDGEK